MDCGLKRQSSVVLAQYTFVFMTVEPAGERQSDPPFFSSSSFLLLRFFPRAPDFYLMKGAQLRPLPAICLAAMLESRPIWSAPVVDARIAACKSRTCETHRPLFSATHGRARLFRFMMCAGAGMMGWMH